MSPDFEKEILTNDTIFENAEDSQYAFGLYSIISCYNVRKRSWNPFSKPKKTDYSKRLAAAIVSILRCEDFKVWYAMVPTREINPKVQKDLKKIGWVIVP